MNQSQQAVDPVLNKAVGRLVKISFGTAIIIGALYLGFWTYDTYVSIEERGVAETLLR
jgi:hypothetical protein